MHVSCYAESLEDVANRLTNYLNKTDLGSTPTIIHGASAGESIVKQVDDIGEVVVKYDPLGFPVFEGRWNVMDVSILGDGNVIEAGLGNMNSQAHQAAATRQILKGAEEVALEMGKSVDDILGGMGFNTTQISQIKKGAAKISDFTWHHHKESGRLQLIVEIVHQEFKHNGGFSLW